MIPFKIIIARYEIEDSNTTKSIDPLKEFFTESLSWPVTIKLEDALSYLLRFQPGFWRSVRSLTHSVAVYGIVRIIYIAMTSEVSRDKFQKVESLRSFSHFRRPIIVQSNASKQRNVISATVKRGDRNFQVQWLRK